MRSAVKHLHRRPLQPALQILGNELWALVAPDCLRSVRINLLSGSIHRPEEEAAQYGSQEQSLFAHERLDAYQVGLEFMRWFHALPAGAELSSRLYRQVDKAATSVALNVAEGNGRYPEADRRKFLDIAEGSAVKAAAYLDLCQSKAELDAGQRERGVGLLARVALMIRGLAAG